jgi:hypothetical protein
MCVPDSEQCPCQSIPPGGERILLTRFLLAPVAAIGAGPVLPSTARPGRGTSRQTAPVAFASAIQEGWRRLLGPCLGAAPLCSSTWLFIEAMKNGRVVAADCAGTRLEVAGIDRM